MPSISPKYSFVIATLRDDGDLALCLRSLSQLHPGPPFEVIIVDQNGDDRLVELLADYSECLQVRHEKVSFRAGSRARNHGARLARGQWLGFPDDDCQLMPDVLDQLERLSTDERVQVISGRTIDPQGQANVLRWRAEPCHFDRWSMFGCLTEATMFVRRAQFLAVGGFDERFGPGARFPAAEGIDLMNRLFSHMGEALALYSPEIQMQHPTKIPPWNRWAVRRFHAYARGDGALIAKSFSPHIVYWGTRMVLVALVQIVLLRGWRSLAYAARLAGLMQGFLAYCIWRGRA